MNMISVSKALSILIKNRFELDVRTVELKKAVGNILAEDFISKITCIIGICIQKLFQEHFFLTIYYSNKYSQIICRHAKFSQMQILQHIFK